MTMPLQLRDGSTHYLEFEIADELLVRARTYDERASEQRRKGLLNNAYGLALRRDRCMRAANILQGRQDP